MKRVEVVLSLVLVSIIAGACAVKTYPREVTANEKMDTNLAWAVDTAGAGLYSKINTGLGYDLERQKVKVDYSYYLDPALKQDPRSFYPGVESPPRVEFAQKIEDTDEVEISLIKWESLYEPQNPAFATLYENYPETQTAYGVFVKSKKPNRGAMVISHGWTGPDVRESYKRENMIEYARIGYDAVLVQQPYHGLRAPADSVFSGEYFFSGEVSRTNEAFCQTVTDVRTMVKWLRESYQVVGLKGGSLGGITTLLTAANDDTIDFAIAWVPPSSMGDMPEDSPLVPFVIEGLRASGLDRAKVEDILYVSSPVNFRPAVPESDILVFAGMGDNFVPPEQPQKIWEAWQGINIVWFAGGHVLNFEGKRCAAIEREFLADRLPE
jgi:dienelactone hydrolase